VQLFEAGRPAELIGHVDAFQQRCPGVEGWPFVRARMCAEAGRIAEARAHFERVAANDFATIPRTEQWPISAVLTADLCHVLGDVARAEILYKKLLAGADFACPVGYGIAYFGTVARHLGNLAATMRRWDDAERHFLRSIELEESMGATPWVAHALYDHARMIVQRDARGARARSKELLARAREIANALGMRGLKPKLEAMP
jgi:tetratricopeptide (TPR) repeat protein